MDCCSSSSYMDYRHHSMNSNFCYPYSPSMLRSASPYALAGPGAPGPARYGSTDYHRSSALGYPGASGGYDGYDKYYGAYHHPAASGYPSGYYGNYSSSYREYGGYGHYYHQSQSPYARGSAALGGSAPYGGGSPAGGYLYPGSRHYPSSSPLGHPFGRESYYHAQHRDHHQQQYSSFANYGSLPPYHRNGMGPGAPDHPTIGGKSQQHPYPQHQSFSGSHTDRGMGPAGGSDGHNGDGTSPSSATSLFNTANGYPSSSADYALPSSYTPGGSPQHPLAGQHDVGAGGALADDGGEQPPSAVTPAPSSQTGMLGATGEFPAGTKDSRMRKPKERKLQRAYGPGGSASGRGSRNSSPTEAHGLSGNGAGTRMKSLDALTNLCWPEGEQFPTRMRKYSNANGFKSKDASHSRKEINELDSPSSTASPGRGVVGPGRRTKKQTGGCKQSTKEAKSAADGKEKPTNGATPTPPVENKNVTPLPGFQQAFGSTEIGKFSEVFFNSSPTPADHSPSQHHSMLQQQHHEQDQQSQQQPPCRTSNGRHGTSVQQLMVMDTMNAYESDVDTLSPPSWDTARGPGPGDTYEGAAGSTGTGYNLQIGTSFHPAYYESSSYSDHAVDSPLGNYFSEMTCNEFVN